MCRDGRAAGGPEDDTGQAGGPRAGRAGGQGQAHEAGRPPRPDGPRRVPWEDLLALVEPLGTGTPRRGRQPWPAETLPQTHLARCRPDLTGVACEDACYDSLSVRDFVGCRYRVPDATTPGDFRHLPGENDVGRALLDVVVARLEATGLVMRGGSEGGATIMEAPSLPEDASGSRDPETRLARKGNQGHLGTRCPSGEDAGSGHARGATLAVAGVPDVREAHALVRPDDGLCHADAAWRGARQARGGPLGPAPLQGRLVRGHGPLQARGPRPGPAGRPREGAEPRPPCARGQAPLPDRQTGLRLREGALLRHREGGECASPPCSPAPTCLCAPGPGGRGSSWGPRWRPPDGGRGDCVPRGRPEGPRGGQGRPRGPQGPKSDKNRAFGSSRGLGKR